MVEIAGLGIRLFHRAPSISTSRTYRVLLHFFVGHVGETVLVRPPG